MVLKVQLVLEVKLDKLVLKVDKAQLVLQEQKASKAQLV